MNARHLELCAGEDWAAAVRDHLIPWTIQDVDLGDDIIEVGPGPGRTTDILCSLAPRVTAVELDPALAAALAKRFAGSNVEVVEADATTIRFPSGRFSAALCFTMLHHVPSPELQDKVLAELARVVRPGGVLAGIDSVANPDFLALHEDDICVPLDPDTLHDRLIAAGFERAQVDPRERRVRFRAWKSA